MNVRIAKTMLKDRHRSRKTIEEHFGVNRNVLYHWFQGGDPDGYVGVAAREQHRTVAEACSAAFGSS